jgi:hypothetical protein
MPCARRSAGSVGVARVGRDAATDRRELRLIREELDPGGVYTQ